jgi:hypothetical protein
MTIMTSTTEIQALVDELDHFVTRFQEWRRALDEHTHGNWKRLNKDGYTHDEFKRESDQLRQKMQDEWDGYGDYQQLLERLCPVYFECGADDRERIRQIVGRYRYAVDPVRWYANAAAKKIEGPDDEQWLLKGLAAVSIENCGMDFRDTTFTMTALWVGAEAAGIDPKPHFRSVAKLSGTSATRGRCGSMARTLERFGVAPGTRDLVLRGRHPAAHAVADSVKKQK